MPADLSSLVRSGRYSSQQFMQRPKSLYSSHSYAMSRIDSQLDAEAQKQQVREAKKRRFWFEMKATSHAGLFSLNVFFRDYLTMVSSMVYAIGFTIFGLIFYLSDAFISREADFYAADVRIYSTTKVTKVGH